MTGRVSEAGGQPWWQVTDRALPGEIRELDQAVRVLQARLVEAVAEADRRGLPGQGGYRRLAGWVQAVLPTTAEASSLAARARTLFTAPVAAELAATREALQAGDISGSQADVVAATVSALVPPAVPAGTVPADTLAEAEAFLLDHATTRPPRQLAQLATYLRHRLDPDADQRLARDEHAQHEVRGLTLAETGTGMVHLEGLLTRTCGAALRTAIDAWSAPQPAADGPPDHRTAAQRRHDGLQRLAEEAVARPGLLPTSHGSPYRVVVTVDHTTLAAALAAQPTAGLRPAVLPNGTALPSGALAQIACGADLVPVLLDGSTDGDGGPLDVGDTQYAFPPKQRTAISVRDQHCTWPGCAALPAWCDVHHLVPFSRGGATAVSNGTLLCGHHHRHVHRAGLIGRLADGAVQWSTGPPAHGRGATRATRALDHLARRWRTHHQV